MLRAAASRSARTNQARHRMTDSYLPNDRQSLSWPRIAGTAFAIALHVAVFM